MLCESGNGQNSINNAQGNLNKKEAVRRIISSKEQQLGNEKLGSPTEIDD